MKAHQAITQRAPALGLIRGQGNLRHPFGARAAGRQNPARRIDQIAAHLAVFGAKTQAFEHRPGLRRPVELRHQKPDHRAVARPPGPDRRCPGHRRPPAQMRRFLDIARHEAVAIAHRHRSRKPMRARDLRPRHRIAAGAAIGQNPTVEAHKPDIGIDRIGIQDHPKPLSGPAQSLAVLALRGGDQIGIGRPPAHVAGAFIKVAVDQIDRGEGAVHQPRAGRRDRELRHHLFQTREPRLQRLAQLVRDLADLPRDLAHLLGHQRESRALLAHPRRLDPGVQAQNVHLFGDLRNPVHRGAGDFRGIAGFGGNRSKGWGCGHARLEYVVE